jgi:hypothetical protein
MMNVVPHRSELLSFWVFASGRISDIHWWLNGIMSTRSLPRKYSRCAVAQ